MQNKTKQIQIRALKVLQNRRPAAKAANTTAIEISLETQNGSVSCRANDAGGLAARRRRVKSSLILSDACGSISSTCTSLTTHLPASALRTTVRLCHVLAAASNKQSLVLTW